jgi:L-alanine-DL-glutamate epimerase-like enolase superfamily enzyme
MVTRHAISHVEVIPYGIPIKNFADAYTTFDRSNAVLVKIESSDGTVGFGEACAWEPEFYGETLESVSTSIARYVAPRIIGMDPLNIAGVMAVVDAALARVTCAKEGIDLALYDLAGKLMNVPVCTLLGGSFRDRIPAASEIGIDVPEKMAENALRLVRMGFRVIKIKGSSDPITDIERVHAVRAAVGESVGLRLDPNAHWTMHDTLTVLHAIEDCKLQYLEQPVPGLDLNGMRKVRNAGFLPLMADESVWTPQDVIELARHDAADIVNIKISKTCGLLGGKKVETVADALGMPCVVGTEIEPGYSLMAKIHFAASMKNLPFACEFTELSLLEESILKPRVELREGCVNVPDGPGFGCELDEEVLSKYTLKPI